MNGMPKIKQLSESIANLIAAGEVIVNMASVIKELVENSIDANASQIKITLKDYGLKEMTVKDNGDGIDHEDLELAFKRHATSKIYSEHDLHHIMSLGFRGEALASIASVSLLTIESSTDGEKSRTLTLKQGDIIEDTIGPKRKGTSISVKNLFYNTPARLKHLKSETKELSLIVDYVNKLALAHPHIAFSLEHNQKTLLNTVGDQDLLKILYQIYDLDIVKEMIPFKNSNTYFKIEGFLAKPAFTRSSRNHMTLIANNRMIKNNSVLASIIAGYKTYLPMHKYPIVLLKITVDPLLIDINIHPQKLEIKFSEEGLLKSLIEKTIEEALKSKELIPKYHKKITKDPDFEQLILEETPSPSFNAVIEESVSSKPKETAPSKRLPNFDYIGQLRGTYLLFQNEKAFYMIDQHAAAERIRYERYLKAMSEKNHGSQTLLVPLKMYLSNQEVIRYTDEQKTFEAFGLKTLKKSETTLLITAIPSWFHPGYEEVYAEHMVKTLLQEETIKKALIVNKLAQDLSCKHSIKANKHLTINEVNALIKDLKNTENPFTCPHGRPTIIEFSHYEIEALFKRVGV